MFTACVGTLDSLSCHAANRAQNPIYPSCIYQVPMFIFRKNPLCHSADFWNYDIKNTVYEHGGNRQLKKITFVLLLHTWATFDCYVRQLCLFVKKILNALPAYQHH